MFDKKQPISEKTDAWSCGAIMYLLLCGKVPFDGETDKEVIANIKAGKVDFSGELWDSISESAKDMIQKLLTVDNNKRICVEDAL